MASQRQGQSRKKALFACYGGGHVAMVIPVARQLIARNWDVQILGLTTAGHRLAAEGLPTIGFADLQRDFGSARSLELGQSLVGDVSHPQIPLAESVAYMGLSYEELEDQLGQEQAVSEYRIKGRGAFFPLRTMKRWLEAQVPDVFVATTSPRAERAGLVAARELGIPAVAIVDFHRPPTPWLMAPENCGDRLCVFARDSHEYFVAHGRDISDIQITGNPAFDTLANPTYRAQAAQLCKERGWKNSQLKILWASQVEPAAHPITGDVGDPSLPVKIEQALLEMLPRHPNWQLIVRPHPSEGRQLLNLPQQVHWSTQREPLHAVLYAVDVVVTAMSTVGLEAALAGKPVISVDLSVMRPELPLSDMRISRGVRDWGALEQALVDVEQGKHPLNPDLPSVGGAAERCCNVIDELVSQAVR
jgi:hypothetical protein